MSEILWFLIPYLIPQLWNTWSNLMQYLKENCCVPFIRCKVSDVHKICLWSFSSKYPTDHLSFHAERAKTCYFCVYNFKWEWATAPHHFSRTGLCLYNSCFAFSANTKHQFGHDYHIYHVLWHHVNVLFTRVLKSYKFKLVMYGFLSTLCTESWLSDGVARVFFHILCA